MEQTLEELRVLLDYLVKHNSEHASEIMDLAVRAKELGNGKAYEELTRGVGLLIESNKSLQSALASLEGQHVSR